MTMLAPMTPRMPSGDQDHRAVHPGARSRPARRRPAVIGVAITASSPEPQEARRARARGSRRATRRRSSGGYGSSSGDDAVHDHQHDPDGEDRDGDDRAGVQQARDGRGRDRRSILRRPGRPAAVALTAPAPARPIWTRRVDQDRRRTAAAAARTSTRGAMREPIDAPTNTPTAIGPATNGSMPPRIR